VSCGQGAFNKIVGVRQRAHDKFGVESTPTSFVNGKRLTGEHRAGDLESMLTGSETTADQ
jgi:protein-disulfide isomerase